MGISIAKAELLALFLEALVYGMFFSLYFLLLVVIAQDKRERPRPGHDLIVWVASVMMIFSTAHLIIDCVRAFQGLTDSRDMESFFHSVDGGTFLAKTVLWMGQTVLGDCILIWRCYIVFSRKVLYVSPMMAGSIVYLCSASAILYNFTHPDPGATSIFNGQYRTWILLYFSSTMWINVLASGAMAWEIFRKTRPMRRTGAVMPVLVAIIDTAALYTAGYLGLLVSFLAGSEGQFAAVDVIMPLIGLTFVLIILQTRFRELLSTGSSGQHESSATTSLSERLRNRYAPHRSQNHALTAISVEITRETEVERDLKVSSLDASQKSRELSDPSEYPAIQIAAAV